MPAPNIVSAYPPGSSTTRVSPGAASALPIDASARDQLDALMSQEKKTGYRSVRPAPVYAPPAAPRSALPAGSPPLRPGGGLGSAGATEQTGPPQKYISYPQPTGYGIYIARELNPEYEQWFESKFGVPYGTGQVNMLPNVAPATSQEEFAPPTEIPYGAGLGGGEGMTPGNTGGMGSQANGGGGPGWYDMPEWQRTQILSQQLYGAGG